MKMCQKCGKILDDSQTVCQVCGTPAARTDTAQSSSAGNVQKDTGYSYYANNVSKERKAVSRMANRPKSNGKIIAIAISAVCVIGAACVLISNLLKDDVQKTTPESPSGNAVTSGQTTTEVSTEKTVSEESMDDLERLRKSMGDWSSPNDSSLSDTEKLRRSMGKYDTQTNTETTASPAETTTTARKKETAAATVKAENDEIYKSYSDLINTSKYNYDNNISTSFFVCDINNDGVQELVIHFMTGARMGDVEIYRFDASSGSSKLISKGHCGSTIGYCKSKGMLFSTTVNSGVGPPEYPSGYCIIVYKLDYSSAEITLQDYATINPDKADQKLLDCDVKISDENNSNFSVNSVKQNAQLNK